jgi:hypothetical protein
MNKRANFVAWFLVVVVIMAFSVFALILNKTWGEIETPLAETLEDNMPDDSPVNVTKELSKVGDTTKNFSDMLPFLIIGLLAFIMITAGSMMKSPAMIFVGMIVMGVLLLISIVFSNVYTGISETTEFTSTANELAIQGVFMEFLPVIVFFIAIGVVVFILYGKSSGGGSL